MTFTSSFGKRRLLMAPLPVFLALSAFGTMSGSMIARADEGGCETGFTAHDGGDFFCDPGLTASDETAHINVVEGKKLKSALGTFKDGDESALAADFLETGHVSTIQWDTGGPVVPLVAADLVKTSSEGEGSTWNVVKDHAYDEGTHHGTIVVNDPQPIVVVSDAKANIPDNQHTVTLHFTVDVADALLCQATAVDQTATEGQTLTDQLIGSFVDNNHLATADDFKVTINWGDGTKSAGTAVQNNTPDTESKCQALELTPNIVAPPENNDPSHWNVIGTHTYAEEGTFPVSFTVLDNKQTADSNTAQAVVADAALGSSCISNLSTTVNSMFNGAVVNFTDADPLGANADYSATINWGDGTGDLPGTITGTGPGGGVSGSHTYAKTGKYVVTVKIADVGGSKTTAVCDPLTNPGFGIQVLAAATTTVSLPKAGSGPHGSVPMGALLLAIAMAVGTVGGYELLMGRSARSIRI
jgi:hypothetical protein